MTSRGCTGALRYLRAIGHRFHSRAIVCSAFLSFSHIYVLHNTIYAPYLLTLEVWLFLCTFTLIRRLPHPSHLMYTLARDIGLSIPHVGQASIWIWEMGFGIAGFGIAGFVFSFFSLIGLGSTVLVSAPEDDLPLTLRLRSTSSE